MREWKRRQRQGMWVSMEPAEEAMGCGCAADRHIARGPSWRLEGSGSMPYTVLVSVPECRARVLSCSCVRQHPSFHCYPCACPRTPARQPHARTHAIAHIQAPCSAFMALPCPPYGPYGTCNCCRVSRATCTDDMSGKATVRVCAAYLLELLHGLVLVAGRLTDVGGCAHGGAHGWRPRAVRPGAQALRHLQR